MSVGLTAQVNLGIWESGNLGHLEMSFFLVLPRDICLLVLVEFLGANPIDILSLDGATTSNSLRPALLDLYQAINFVLNTDLLTDSLSASFIEWVSSRQVKASSLRVCEGTQQLLAHLNPALLSAVRTLRPCDNREELDFEMLTRLFNTCPLLCGVDGRVWYMVDSAQIRMLASLRPLRSIRLHHFVDGSAKEEISPLVIKHGATLLELHLKPFVDSIVLETVQATCLRLTALTLNVTNIPSTVLISVFTKQFASLRSIELVCYSSTVKQTVAACIVRGCPQLEVLDLGTCRRMTSSLVLAEILQINPLLQRVKVGYWAIIVKHGECSVVIDETGIAALDLITKPICSLQCTIAMTDQCLHKIAQKCGPSMRSLKVHVGSGCSAVGLAQLLSCCPLLEEFKCNSSDIVTDFVLHSMVEGSKCIKRLEIGGLDFLTDYGVIAVLTAYKHQLVHLSLNVRHLTSAILNPLGDCSELVSVMLVLSDHNISGTDLFEHLVLPDRLPKLSTFTIPYLTSCFVGTLIEAMPSPVIDRWRIIMKMNDEAPAVAPSTFGGGGKGGGMFSFGGFA